MTMTTTTLTATASNGTQPATRLTAHDLETSTGTLPVLGFTAQWSLLHVEIAHHDLVKALQAAGFITIGPERPSPTIALRRALVKWLHNRTSTTSNPQLEGALGFELGLEEAGEWEENDSFEDGQGSKPAPKESGTKPAARTHTPRHKNLIRKINNPQSDWLVFGLVVEHLDLEALGLSYATRLRIFLHKKTQAIRVSQTEAGVEPAAPNSPSPASSPSHEANFEVGDEDEDAAESSENIGQIRREVEELFHHYREHHQARDISMLLRQLVGRLDSFSLRRLGGVYFVPQQHRAALDQLRYLVDTLPAPAGEVSDKFLLILPVLDGVGAKKGLAQAAHRDFMAELATLQADLHYLSSEAENHRVRATTVAGRLKEYRELKAKAEVYAELLDMQGEKILGLLQNLTSEATRLLDSVAEPMPCVQVEQGAFDWDTPTPSQTASF